MEYIKKLNLSFKSLPKLFAVLFSLFAGIVVIIVLFSFLNGVISKFVPGYNVSNDYYSNTGSKLINKAGFLDEFSYSAESSEVMPILEPVGDTFYEMRRYNSLIKSSKIIDDCKSFSELKEKDYIIFENSNFYEKRCNFRFKALKDNELDVVAFIEDFSPDYINLNISNIVKEINNYDSRLDSLNSRLEAVEDTLLKSRKAYDDIALLATKEKDVETLAKVIDNKLNLIDKMNNKKLNLLDEISRYNKYKNDSLEKVDYVHFDVSITKDVLLDTKELKEGWRESFSQWLGDLNSIVKSLTLYLLFYIVKFIQYAIYFLLLVGGVKFVYRFAKCLWKRV